MTVNYNDGKWHGWDGGECPVHPDTMVEVTSGSCQTSGKANDFTWHHNCYGPIIAFRVIKEHREPREFWVTKKTLFDLDGNISGYAYHQSSEKDGDFKVREVIE